MNPNDWTIQDYHVDVEAIWSGPLYDNTTGEYYPGEKTERLVLVRKNRPATYEPDALIGLPVRAIPTHVRPAPIVDTPTRQPREGDPL